MNDSCNFSDIEENNNILNDQRIYTPIGKEIYYLGF